MRKYIDLLVILVLFVIVIPNTASADQVILNPIDDARVWAQFPDNNYGSSADLTIGYLNGHFKTFIKFDLSPYAGATINSAYLRLYVFDGSFPMSNIYIGTNTTDWNEEILTWNNKPSLWGYTYISSPSSYDWWVIDVTDWIQDMVNGSIDSYGFQIGRNIAGLNRLYMRSKEAASNHPELELNYTPSSVESETMGHIKVLFR